MKPTGPMNENVKEIIREARKLANKQNSKFWKDLAYRLERPRRKKKGVNVSKISRHIQEGEVAVVPYKLLGNGDVDKNIVVATLYYSSKAKQKIEEKGGKVMSIRELMKKNPKGKGVRIFE